MVGFVTRVLLYYGLLAWVPWPGVREGYSAFYREGANLLFGLSGKELMISFRTLRDPSDPAKDLELVTRRRGTAAERTTPIDSRLSGYLPTVVVIALTLATPIRWSRRVNAMLWGLVWVNLFIALREIPTLLYTLTSPPPFHEGLNPMWSKLAYRVYEVIGQVPTTSFIVPALIWLVVTFRGGDLRGVSR
jgi:hypothetical protein